MASADRVSIVATLLALTAIACGPSAVKAPVGPAPEYEDARQPVPATATASASPASAPAPSPPSSPPAPSASPP